MYACTRGTVAALPIKYGQVSRQSRRCHHSHRLKEWAPDLETKCMKRQVCVRDIKIVSMNEELRKYQPFWVNEVQKRHVHTISRLKGVYKRKTPVERTSPSTTAPIKACTLPSTSEKSSQCNSIGANILGLKREIDHLNALILDQQDNLTKKRWVTTRETIQGRPYTNAVREVYYEFLSRGVSADNIPHLIKNVLHSLADCDIDELPSHATASDFVVEVGDVARQHLAESLHNRENVTIQRDATTKQGHHFYGLKMSTVEGETLTVGVLLTAMSNVQFG
jgi:hypothetical protein